MNIRKLPSGNYQIRKQYKGKRYSITLDHKPTQRELMQILADKLDEQTNDGSFGDFCEEYIKIKSSVLSPTTIRGYNSILRSLSRIKDIPLDDITQEDVQIEINIYGATHTPKTVKNTYGLISSVLAFFRPDMSLRVTLPTNHKKEPYIPSDEDVRAILELAKGTDAEIALWLACYGLRRGEICAITSEDLSDDNMLTINKSKAVTDKGVVIKSPKTVASYRTIAIPAHVASLIRKKGCAYDRNMHTLLKSLHRFQDELNIPHFRLHDLRHYFASTLSSAGVPENDLLKMGGWSTPSVMKTIYRHSMLDKDAQAKKELSEKLSEKLS